MRGGRPGLLWIRAVGCALAWSLLASPAGACGCGGYVPSEGDARVAQERALIRWDGETEDIVMQLSVEGQSEDAAWFLPVPERATVRLADPGLFDELEELTKPIIQVETVSEWMGAEGGGANGAAVEVLGRQALGPIDVTTLTASDAGTLGGWLDANGYEPPDGLERAVRPYVEQD